jgi:hypothetical protein
VRLVSECQVTSAQAPMVWTWVASVCSAECGVLSAAETCVAAESTIGSSSATHVDR